MWHAILRGLVLGFVAGIPVGPVNAAVIDTAVRKCMRRAIAIGLGGAFADFVYSQLAVAGLAPLLQHHPELSSVLLGVGGIVLVVFGVHTARSSPACTPCGRKPMMLGRALLASFGTGILITLANPAALVSWVLVAGTVLADLSRTEALVAGAGVFVGTSAWLLSVAWLSSKGRGLLGRHVPWMMRAIGAGLVVYGVFLVGKAGVVWAGSQ
ncbi:MAG: LysE family transporter [Deltaproteobacteria bacterium]|nr:LysE family transporter [Deltaproteobacteria bacterium]